MVNEKISSRKSSLLVAFLILLAGVFLGGYLVLKSGKVSAGQLDQILNPSSSGNICQPNSENPDNDADKDGLKDWQEIQIYQSDPCKTDSDGDGYLDGEEITSGYNPIVKAPGDELPGTAPKGPRPLPENLTKALSSALAQQIVNGKIESFSQDGQILSPAELSAYPAIRQSVMEISAQKDSIFAAEPIADAELRVSQDNSGQAISKYLNDLENILKKSSLQPSDVESQIFLDFMQNGGPGTIIQQAQQDYQNAFNDLKKITVPSKFLDLHKRQLNIFSQLAKIYSAIITTEADPLRASLALEQYSSLLEQIVTWSKDFANTLQNK